MSRSRVSSSIKSFITYPDGLIDTSDTIDVCWLGGDQAARARVKGQIDRALTEWLKHIGHEDPIYTQKSCTRSIKDFSVELRPGSGRAFVRNFDSVVLYSNSTYRTVLHEIGHVLGLADTYIEDVWTCKEGQPDSIMCNQSTLTQDDIDGIKKLNADEKRMNPSPNGCQVGVICDK
ncbi:hypothetical protein [Pseudobacteriovorax antillogorgiicola]|uniref:Matrixin n=1 Tax=Pseudobacteriovorax antillogorgiicola TaxID=1513793 RepID=A0A1Y6BXJ1_9BACT|nr:hypothetical protein [Pseudobacteriovorax antillogorgiicola]TCS50225.1 hypothetical protein EDD56_11343 [Pseudobacteriovorax antillogorgiicola]SMF32619.1 hypothetical protein SAMN06296036_11042 [Pseudobacteriovorax antillogorgiicola]